MSFFRRRSARPKTTRAEPGELPQRLTSDLSPKESLEHCLRMLAKAIDDEVFQQSVSRLRRRVERSSGAAELEDAAQDVLALKIPIATVDESTFPGARLLGDALAQLSPVAAALQLHNVEDAITSLAGDVEHSDEPSVRTRLGSQLAALAEGATFVRSTADVYRLSIGQFVDTLGPLARDEPAALQRLTVLRQRLVDAGDLDELEKLRASLLDETSALVREAERRTSSAHVAKETIEQAQAEVQLLSAALDDANAMATTDPLTGLGNRRAMDVAVERLSQGGGLTGVIAIDVDHFKRVNDTYGHDGGDRVLRHVARLIADELRGLDEAFRVGGEELTVLLSDTALEGAAATAERLRQRLEQTPLCFDATVVEVTFSAGVTCWGPGEKFGAASKRADEALYAAKDAGRNRVAVTQIAALARPR